MSNNLSFVFPGQGSQSVGMLGTLAGISPVVRATFDEASAVLGYDLWQLCSAGPLEALNETERTQPAMLVAGIATRHEKDPQEWTVRGSIRGPYNRVTWWDIVRLEVANFRK